METIKDAKLVNVQEQDGKITLTFLGNEKVYDVIWNKKKFDTNSGEFVESEEKENTVEEWSKQYFKCSTSELPLAIGTILTVYSYDTYASLWESQAKFTKEQFQKKENTVIDAIDVTDEAILIYYKFDGEKHRSRMGYSTKVGDSYYLNPIQQKKQFTNFKNKFGVDVKDRGKLIGKKIQVTVKRAFSHYYGEITFLE